MKAAGIILAAGESRRMGRPKALLNFRDGTFLSVLSSAFSAFCHPVIAVFGFDGERLAETPPPGVAAVINSDYRLGMLTSLQAGIRALGAIQTRVAFTLVDHPAVEPGTLATLMAADEPIVIPCISGKRGHPVVVSPEIVAEFLREPVTSKIRDVIDRHRDCIRYIEVNDPGISDDIDDEAAYRALLAREGMRH